MSVAFDTLKFARALQGKAKLSAEQAEGIAEAFADATGEQLATKADLAALRADLRELGAATKSDLLALAAAAKLDLREVGTGLRAEITDVKSELRTEIASVKADVSLLKWMMGFVLAFQVGIFAKLFLR